MTKGEELVRCRRVQRNIASAVENLTLCLPGLLFKASAVENRTLCLPGLLSKVMYSVNSFIYLGLKKKSLHLSNVKQSVDYPGS